MRELKIFISISTLIVTALIVAFFLVVFSNASEDVQREKDNTLVQIAAHLRHAEASQQMTETLLKHYNLEDIDINGFQANSDTSTHWLISIFPRTNRKFVISENSNYVVGHLNTARILDGPISIFTSFLAVVLISWLLLILVYIRILRSTHDSLESLIQSGLVPKHPVLGNIGELLTQQQQEVKQTQQSLEEEKLNIYQNSLLHPLTRLRNKLSFNDYINERLNDGDIKNHSAVVFIRGTQLAKINETLGGEHGDRYLVDLKQIIDSSSSRVSKRLIFHFNGAEFVCFGEFKTEQQLSLFLSELCSAIQHYSSKQNYDSTAVVAATHLDNKGNYVDLMRRLYLGIASAQLTNLDGWVIQEDDQVNVDDDQQWGQILKQVIDAGNITLESQAIQTTATMSQRYSEIYCRFKDAQDNYLPTQTTFVMAQRLGFAENLEKTVIRKILKTIPKTQHSDRHFGINISEDALLSKSFLIWLERELNLDLGLCKKLVFEIPEHVLLAHQNACLRFCIVLRRLGCRVAISHFGEGFDSFKLLEEIKPNYVKLHRKIIENIATDVASKHICRLVIDVAHQLNVLAIAEGVEDREQRQLLERYHIDGIQGYLVGKPQSMIA
ncbi:EAL domain-containing protein [Alginatibacterium sediminis]|uniref:EAL domain-containing protein n=1 Tax=Alginatibacterium sediminis TaxID=2164068 RepID=A0A420EGZ4_9ALTE|nr:EAL domain-containing protein [Alginatibacterium sediminis]RKF19934.1 EAL domain-containing protein [Alginatibacterium sediminis]